MKILQLCNKPPLPSRDGGCIAINNITQGLIGTGHEVKILTIFTDKHPLLPESFPDEYTRDTRIEGVYVDTTVNTIDAFSNLLTRDSYNISRFFSPDFDMKLIQTLRSEEFDIIHLESLFMSPYLNTIRRHSKAKVVLRSHNHEFIIWERMAIGERGGPKKMYLQLLSRQLKKYELEIIDEVDGIAAISGEDAKKYRDLGCSIPLVTIPFGIDFQNYIPDTSKLEVGSLFHLGSMDWLPNREGVEWLLNGVWSRVEAMGTDAKLHLAGKSMDTWENEFVNDNAIIEGEVLSAVDFMNSKDIMLVPIKSAGGVRVKIIEGMALGKTIISTRIGAEGIDVEHGKHILIANTEQEFADAIATALNDPALQKRLGKNARKLVKEKYDNKLITNKLISFYQHLIDS